MVYWEITSIATLTLMIHGSTSLIIGRNEWLWSMMFPMIEHGDWWSVMFDDCEELRWNTVPINCFCFMTVDSNDRGLTVMVNEGQSWWLVTKKHIHMCICIYYNGFITMIFYFWVIPCFFLLNWVIPNGGFAAAARTGIASGGASHRCSLHGSSRGATKVTVVGFLPWLPHTSLDHEPLPEDSPCGIRTSG